MFLAVLGLLLNITPANAIIGGAPVSMDEEISRSTVLLYGQSSQGGTFICTGSILNQQYILSAAHCLTDVRDMLVIFSNRAETDAQMAALLRERTLVRQVVGVNHNVDFPNTALGASYPFNDIGLIKFAGGIPSGFKPVTILNPSVMSKYVKPGEDVLIAGYGQRSGNGSETGSLFKNVVKVKQSFTKTVVVGESGSSACHGDSGGPAFVSVGGKLYQWGVLSRGEPGCTSSAIYTPLTSNFFGKMGTPSGL